MTAERLSSGRSPSTSTWTGLSLSLKAIVNWELLTLLIFAKRDDKLNLRDSVNRSVILARFLTTLWSSG